MHPSIIVLSAAAWALSATSARASVNPSPSSQTIEVSAGGEHLRAAQALLAQGGPDSAFEMSTGRRMTVNSWGQVLQVKYGRRAPVYLRHDGNGAFVSRDGLVELRFELNAQGAPTLVRMTLPQSWQ